jgi:hypothetical protein
MPPCAETSRASDALDMTVKRFVVVCGYLNRIELITS